MKMAKNRKLERLSLPVIFRGKLNCVKIDNEGIIEKDIEGTVQSPSLTTFIVLTFIFDILRKLRSENLHQ